MFQAHNPRVHSVTQGVTHAAFSSYPPAPFLSILSMIAYPSNAISLTELHLSPVKIIGNYG